MQKAVQYSVQLYDIMSVTFYALVGTSQIAETVHSGTCDTVVHPNRLQKWSS